MKLTSRAREMILRRLAELEPELRQAREDLRKLRTRDPATADVVIRGARLYCEKSGLERRLEEINAPMADRPT